MPSVSELYESDIALVVPIHLWEPISLNELENARNSTNAEILRDQVYHYLLKFRRNLKAAEKLPSVTVPENKADPRMLSINILYEITLVFRRIYYMHFDELKTNFERIKKYIESEKIQSINSYVHARTDVIESLNQSMTSYVQYGEIIKKKVIHGQKLLYMFLNLQLRGFEPRIVIKCADEEKLIVAVNDCTKLQAIFSANCYGYRKEWEKLIKNDFHSAIHKACHKYLTMRKKEYQSMVSWEDCYLYVYESVAIYGLPKAEFAKFYVTAAFAASKWIQGARMGLPEASYYQDLIQIPALVTNGKKVLSANLASKNTQDRV